MGSVRNMRLEVEAERIRQTKEEARQEDRELLTPKAAQRLFQKSAEATRKAIHAGNIEVVFDLWVTEKSVALIRLSSAVAFWGEPDPQKLEAMRENGHTLGYGTVTYNVLLPRSLLTLRDPQELETDD